MRTLGATRPRRALVVLAALVVAALPANAVAQRKAKAACSAGAPCVTTIAGGGYSDWRPATEANLATPTDLAIDPAGNVYVSDGSEGRIRKIDVNGIISTFAGNGIRGYRGDGGPATQARIASPRSLAWGPDGSLYFVDDYYGVVRKVGPDGAISTFAGSQDAPLRAGSIEFGPDGKLYFTGSHTLARLEGDGSTTVIAGTGLPGYSGDGGPATEAQLNFPGDLAFGPGGEIYVADNSNRRVRKIDVNGIITTIAGTGEYASSGDGGPAGGAALITPTHVTAAPDGSVYVSDGRAERIRKIAPDGTITTLIGTGTTGYSGDGGPAAQAAVNAPFDSAVDAHGNVLFVDAGNDRIRRIDAAGVVTTFAGNGVEWFLGDGERATAAAFRLPGGAAEGPDGALYVADTNHERIRRVDPVTNVVSTYAGTGELGFSGDGGPATEAELGDPWDVDVDGAGNVYVADYWNNRIRKISPAGIITTVAGNGTTQHSGDGGPATAAGMDHPTAIDYHEGELFIAVGGSRAIRKVDRNGIITTIAGKGYLPASDGTPASLVALKGPTDVAALPDGSVVFADAFDHRVLRIDFEGRVPVIEVVAGTGTAGFSGDGGAATEADFHYPWGLLPLPDGSLLVTDHNNHRIRRIDPEGIVTTVAGDGRDELAGDGGHPLQASFRGPTNLTMSRLGPLVTDSANGRIRLVRI